MNKIFTIFLLLFCYRTTYSSDVTCDDLKEQKQKFTEEWLKNQPEAHKCLDRLVSAGAGATICTTLPYTIMHPQAHCCFGLLACSTLACLVYGVYQEEQKSRAWAARNAKNPVDPHEQCLLCKIFENKKGPVQIMT